MHIFEPVCNGAYLLKPSNMGANSEEMADTGLPRSGYHTFQIILEVWKVEMTVTIDQHGYEVPTLFLAFQAVERLALA
jgi:hypothetical protein